jgi:hypothetical protein
MPDFESGAFNRALPPLRIRGLRAVGLFQSIGNLLQWQRRAAGSRRGAPWQVVAPPASRFASHDPRTILALCNAGHPRLRALHLMVDCPAAQPGGPALCARSLTISRQACGGERLSTIRIVVSGSFGLTVIPLALVVAGQSGQTSGPCLLASEHTRLEFATW